ncbi:MAG: GTP-binding protein [Candidatus Helarchaeota archaeon]|nr:GTP-binding protein [Candidatus Helarchaeota archaeon]
MARERKFVFKIVVIGDGAVGKTSLIARFAEKTFQAEYKPTLGTNIVIKELKLDNNNIKLLLWDIAGQAKWRDVRHLYYKGAQGCILVFDVTRPGTFDSIPSWQKDLVKFSGDIPRILLANKVDLSDIRKITTEQAQVSAKDLNAAYFETSAKDGTQVNDAFAKISSLILNKV